MELSGKGEWEDFTGREELLTWQWVRHWNKLENRSGTKYNLSENKHADRNEEMEEKKRGISQGGGGGNQTSFLTK